MSGDGGILGVINGQETNVWVMNRVKNRLLTKCRGDKWIGMKEILGSEKRVYEKRCEVSRSAGQ